jgi:hypothetical protein
MGKQSTIEFIEARIRHLEGRLESAQGTPSRTLIAKLEGRIDGMEEILVLLKGEGTEEAP